MTAAIDVIQYKKTAGDTDYPTKDSNLIDTLQAIIAAPQWPYSYDPATTVGLTLGYTGGQILLDGVLTAISGGTVALSASTTNYIEATRSGTLSKNTTGFTAGQIPLYIAVTGGSAITTLTDVRAFNQPHFGRLSLASTGGTTTLSYAQARVDAIDVTGTLVSNATIEVPAAPWQWAINNGTSGAYTLTVKVNGQTGVSIPQGERRVCVCDATDVRALTGYAVAAHTHTGTYQPADADLDTWATKTAPAGTVIGTSDTQTMTNKRVTARVGSATSSATPTINTDSYDIYKLTAQAEAVTSFTTNLSGTPTDGQVLLIQITGTSARALTWGASFEASTVALPSTTVSTNMLTVAFIWNTATSKWRCVASV